MNLLQNLFKDEKVIIQEIHNSFDNAQDELLKQATSIIEQYKPNLSNKAERLEKLGFVNSETVVKNIDRKKVLISSKKDADLVNYYKTSYPFLKFLKEEQLNAICKKYNLIYAPVGRYKEDVPEKNVTEIENAQPLKTEDFRKEQYFIKVTDFGSWNVPEDLKKILSKGFISDESFDKSDSDIIDAAKKYGGYYGNFRGICLSKCLIEKTDYNGLFIAAPKSHFDLDGLKNKTLGFFNFSITEVKDPIVFRYVKEGIQVLSKWGLEANDEMLQQEILN